MTPEISQYGECIKRVRRENNWTLKELSARTGIPVSSLSKVERGLLALSFANLQKLAGGLKISFTDLLESPQTATSAKSGLKSVTRCNTGVKFNTDTYAYENHATDIKNKKMETMVVRAVARTIEEHSKLEQNSHTGEEFIYVLEGSVRVYTEHYEPEDLNKGDSIYIDSSMWHAIVSTSEEDALFLSVCSNDRV